MPAGSRSPDPYVVLGLTPGATEEEIKKAWRDLAKLFHPDRLAGMSADQRQVAEEQLKRINEAYETLCDGSGVPPNDAGGTASGSVPEPELSQSRLDFGALKPDESRQKVVTLRNRASGDASWNVSPDSGTWFRLDSHSDSPGGGVVLAFQVFNDSSLALGPGRHETEVLVFLDDVPVVLTLTFEAVRAGSRSRAAPEGRSGAVGAPPAATSERVLRFNRTERWVHWTQASTFLVLLFTGLAISLSWMEALIGHRALLREIHLAAAFFFVFGPAIIAIAGDTRSIRDDAREVDRWSPDDVRLGARHGRYNGGQKANAIFTVYSTLAFGVTGLILWQNRRYPFTLFVSEANTVHQWLAYLALLVFLGHLFLATLYPPTRRAFLGIITGTVDRSWATRHHPAWAPSVSEPPLLLSVLIRALTTVALGLVSAALLARIGFEALGANVTDPVIKGIYRFSGWPGTFQHAATGSQAFDLGAAIWLGLFAAALIATRHGESLLPRRALIL
jgi:formate dehydrogenase subunit gamma